MEQNALTPSDWPEIGPIDDVSKIIKGQQALKTQQIRALSERFHVSRDVFFL
jgi:antitoxin component HigA of HigAB toxin-antitoxin module